MTSAEKNAIIKNLMQETNGNLEEALVLWYERHSMPLKEIANRLNNIFSPKYPDTPEFEKAKAYFYSLPTEEKQRLKVEFNRDKVAAITSLIPIANQQ